MKRTRFFAVLGVVLLAAVALVVTPEAGLFVTVGMAALAADRITETKEKGFKSYPVATNTVIYNGSLVAINSGGYAVPASDTAALKVAGVARSQANNNPGANGAVWVKVEAPIIARFAAASITQAMVGTQMYIVDDQTFDDATGTNSIKAGRLVEFISTTEGWLEVRPFE